MIFKLNSFIFTQNFVVTKKTRDQKHKKVATAVTGATLSYSFNREFFLKNNKTWINLKKYLNITLKINIECVYKN